MFTPPPPPLMAVLERTASDRFFMVWRTRRDFGSSPGAQASGIYRRRGDLCRGFQFSIVSRRYGHMLTPDADGQSDRPRLGSSIEVVY